MITALAACGEESAPRITREGKQDVVGVTKGDLAMDAAIARARASVDTLVNRLRNSSQPLLAQVKAPFGSGDQIEHMWVGNLSYDSRALHGRLASDPVWNSALHRGDSVRLLPQDISDWTIVEGGVLLGGYTIHELRRRMPAGERARFDSTRRYRLAADTAISTLPRRD